MFGYFGLFRVQMVCKSAKQNKEKDSKFISMMTSILLDEELMALFTLLTRSKEIIIILVMPKPRAKFQQKNKNEIMCHSVTVTPFLENDIIFVTSRQKMAAYLWNIYQHFRPFTKQNTYQVCYWLRVLTEIFWVVQEHKRICFWRSVTNL